MQRTVLIAIFVAALGLLACGERSDDEASPLEPGDTVTEHVPLPAAAKPVSGVEDAWSVPGATYEDVRAFYEQQMPEGKPHGGWRWCDIGGGKTIHAHIYVKGRRSILAVTVSEGKQPSILIRSDRSGPC